MARVVLHLKKPITDFEVDVDINEVDIEVAGYVKVVRCKDCRYWSPATEDSAGYCGDLMTADENGFCSWAEEKRDG